MICQKLQLVNHIQHKIKLPLPKLDVELSGADGSLTAGLARSLVEKKRVVRAVIEETVNEGTISQGKLVIRTVDEKTVADESIADMVNKKI